MAPENMKCPTRTVKDACRGLGKRWGIKRLFLEPSTAYDSTVNTVGMGYNPQLYPLEVNPTTGEPFLRLRGHHNIIITPPRPEDVPAMVPYHNDPRICEYLGGPPFPYTLAHAQSFFDITRSLSDRLLSQLEDTKDQRGLVILENCPVRAIREVHEDGSDTFIGDIGFMRCPIGELMGTNAASLDWENKTIVEERNNKLPAGDPNIIWSIGDFLAPSHHGRGIMTEAVRTILHDWGVPRMGIRHVWVSTFTGNDGSVKVFMKNGFKLIYTCDEHKEAKGKMRGINVLEWKYGES
ncbi:hypothetical protein JR316_0000449 [Psilocybe cubensis]|uniref:Uncharacterized protein n=1 Tax=Psilocybe cubensis TaxID=181762 RepID=A0ACB8HEE3_PSICU|nr:hypothetical protein JR316_0000449 [Psilocybe cubensis]KAH9486385.1 hypothetical protein JR316_0000449 [Psilocybe cubensis]